MGEQVGRAGPAVHRITGVLDIELTSRCNASCTFCPRDETPRLGTMDEATFELALARAVEYRDVVRALPEAGFDVVNLVDDTIWLSFCGTGDALVHPRAVDHVGRVAEAGLLPLLNTNGARLDPDRTAALLDAGLASVCVNAGELGEDYEAVYGLPWQRTHDNLVALAELAAGRCKVTLIVVDHRGDPGHVARVRSFWAERGITAVVRFDLVNRAGALPVADQELAHRTYEGAARARFEAAGIHPRCGTPFAYPIIGYDGQYHLCSSDWRKEVPLGHVADTSVAELFATKLGHVTSREPACRRCSHDPINAMARALAARDAAAADGGDVAAADAQVASLLAHAAYAEGVTDRLAAGFARPVGAAPVADGPPAAGATAWTPVALSPARPTATARS